MTFLFGEPIVLLANGASVVNEYGDPVPSQTATTVTGAFSPGVSVEDQADDTASSQPTVYLPSGTDVSWVDAVQVRGVTYQVDGAPRVWVHPFTGWQAGVEVRLRGVLAEPR